MKTINFETKKITGLSVRTKNIDEAEMATAKIGKLWQSYFAQASESVVPDSGVYGVYYNYESDASGEFDIMAGRDSLVDQDVSGFETIEIKAGKYLVFSREGAMPQAVIEAWQEIWQYFSGDNCEHDRLYQTDFEFYKSMNEIEVYIGIK